MAIAPALGPALVTLRGDRGPLVRNTRRNRMIAAALSILLAVAAAWAVDSVTAGGSLSVEPGGEASRTVSVTIPQTAPVEVLVLVDTTGSEHAGIEAAVGRVSSALAATDATLHVGVGVIGDYPLRPFGTVADRPLAITQAVTADTDAWGAALAALTPARVGGDPAEAQLGALAETMTSAFAEGGPGFTPGATHVVIVATDAASHEGGDVGCDERGTCAEYPGPRSADVAADAVELGFSIVAIGDIPAADPLRAVATVIDAPADGAADTLAEWLRPGPVELPLLGTCDAESVTITHEPGVLSGRPGESVEVTQTVSAAPDATGSVSCTVAGLDALDVVVDVEVPDDEQTPEPDAPAREGGERTEAGDVPVPEEEPAEAAPEPAVLDITVTIDAGTTFAFDARLGNDVLKLLADEHDAAIELAGGSLDAAGFGDDVTFAVTVDPGGELVVPDELEPTAWVLTPGPGTEDTFTYEVVDAGGVVVAEVTVTVVTDGSDDAEDLGDAAETEGTEDTPETGGAEETEVAEETADDGSTTEDDTPDGSEPTGEPEASDGGESDGPEQAPAEGSEAEGDEPEQAPADEAGTDEPGTEAAGVTSGADDGGDPAAEGSSGDDITPDESAGEG